MNASTKDLPKVISRPWDGSHPPPAPKEPTAAELGAVVRKGIRAYRALPDDTATRFNLTRGPASEAERQQLIAAGNDRNDANAALDQLIAMAARAPAE